MELEVLKVVNNSSMTLCLEVGKLTCSFSFSVASASVFWEASSFEVSSFAEASDSRNLSPMYCLRCRSSSRSVSSSSIPVNERSGMLEGGVEYRIGILDSSSLKRPN